MTNTIAIIGAGAMGSAVGRRLVGQGARVVTYLQGRGDGSVARADAAGMEAVDLSGVAAADIVLSIVPPSTALAVAESLVHVFTASVRKPAYVDFNAINPATMRQVAAALSGTGCDVIDGAIIGSPPGGGGAGPSFYVSGDADFRTEILSVLKLKLRRIEGEIGAASALKMVFSGINKGITGLGVAILLAAAKSDSAEGLRTAMSENAPEIQTRLRRSVPDMYPKAYRWVGEMMEIAEFLGPDNPAYKVFQGMAGIFSEFADDFRGGGNLIAEVDAALGFDHPQL